MPDPGDDDDLIDIVPAAVAREHRHGAPPRAPAAHSFARLLRRRVIVVAAGITYRGLLHGADETDLYLRGELRWFVLPLDTVRSVEPDRERDGDDDDDDDDVVDAVDASRGALARRGID